MSPIGILLPRLLVPAPTLLADIAVVVRVELGALHLGPQATRPAQSLHALSFVLLESFRDELADAFHFGLKQGRLREKNEEPPGWTSNLCAWHHPLGENLLADSGFSGRYRLGCPFLIDRLGLGLCLAYHVIQDA